MRVRRCVSAVSARAVAGDDGGVVPAARGAGAEVREGVHAGGGGMGRRGAAHAHVRGAAGDRAGAVRVSRGAASLHLPHLQSGQVQSQHGGHHFTSSLSKYCPNVFIYIFIF